MSKVAGEKQLEKVVKGKSARPELVVNKLTVNQKLDLIIELLVEQQTEGVREASRKRRKALKFPEFPKFPFKIVRAL